MFFFFFDFDFVVVYCYCYCCYRHVVVCTIQGITHYRFLIMVEKFLTILDLDLCTFLSFFENVFETKEIHMKRERERFNTSLSERMKDGTIFLYILTTIYDIYSIFNTVLVVQNLPVHLPPSLRGRRIFSIFSHSQYHHYR